MGSGANSTNRRFSRCLFAKDKRPETGSAFNTWATEGFATPAEELRKDEAVISCV